LDRWLGTHGIVTGAELLEVARVFAAVRRERDMLPGPDGTYAARGLERPQKLSTFIAHTVRLSYDCLTASSDAELVERFSARLQRRRADESCQGTQAQSGQRLRRRPSAETADELPAVRPSELKEAHLTPYERRPASSLDGERGALGSNGPHLGSRRAAQ
jgi:hypothetical protein